MHRPFVGSRLKTLVSMQGRLLNDAARLKAHIVLFYIKLCEFLVQRLSEMFS